jgi:hypothetical protein
MQLLDVPDYPCPGWWPPDPVLDYSSWGLLIIDAYPFISPIFSYFFVLNEMWLSVLWYQLKLLGWRELISSMICSVCRLYKTESTVPTRNCLRYCSWNQYEWGNMEPKSEVLNHYKNNHLHYGPDCWEISDTSLICSRSFILQYYSILVYRLETMVVLFIIGKSVQIGWWMQDIFIQRTIVMCKDWSKNEIKRKCKVFNVTREGPQNVTRVSSRVTDVKKAPIIKQTMGMEGSDKTGTSIGGWNWFSALFSLNGVTFWLLLLSHQCM